MQKIMFNNTYGLTEAVRKLLKNLTRREFQYYDGSVETTLIDGYLYIYKDTEKKELLHKSRYHIGEVVAIAESYKTVLEQMNDAKGGYGEEENEFFEIYKDTQGWTNKMFVKPDLMTDGIQITDIWCERLKDITDIECIREGIKKKGSFNHRHKRSNPFYFEGGKHSWDNSFPTPRKAFAALIDKMNGKGTWKKNPYVVVYRFAYVMFN